jgi:hypothetical protein
MELALNSAWFLLAAALVCLWLRTTPCCGTHRSTEIVALIALALILLPAISMTDDLMAAQNPAEADNCLRRDQSSQPLWVLFPPPSALPSTVFAGLPRTVFSGRAHVQLPNWITDTPDRGIIQNRPPPAA